MGSDKAQVRRDVDAWLKRRRIQALATQARDPDPGCFGGLGERTTIRPKEVIMAASDPIVAAEAFDFDAVAELFSVRGRKFGSQSTRYRRFERAAEAIRFVIEELPQPLLVGVCLEVEGLRFDGNGMRRLYESVEYPLVRRAAA